MTKREVTVLYLFLFVMFFIGIVMSLFSQINQINKQLEYHYKDFTHMDIDKAMKFHGTDHCIIKEGQEPYFVDAQGREIILFTDSCIEHLYKEKQREMRKVGE